MIRKLLSISILSLIILLTACNSSKQVGTGKATTEYAHSDERLKTVIEQNATDWNVISVPVKLELKSPANISASARAYVCRDSSIYFSVRFLGMEIAMIDITNDSIIAVDKYHKYYAAERLTDVLANVSFDINSVQSLLFAHPFTHTEHISDIKQASLFKTFDKESDEWTAAPVKQNPLADYTFTYFKMDNNPKNTVISTAIGTITANYEDVKSSSIGISPAVTDIVINSQKLKAKLSIRWSWKDVRTDNPSDKKHITIPKGYQRINAAALLKAFVH